MNTRRIAAKVISCTLKQGQSLTVALDNTLETVASSQDKAFIQALCYGTLRYFHRLDFILKQLLKKPVKDEEIKALILIGLYQLQYMRVKPHAAVSETVAALSKKKQHAKALINAILRRYLREQQDQELAADQEPCAAYAHPNWLIRLIATDWPEQQKAILLQNNLQAPMVLRVNTQLETLASYQQKLLTANINAVNSPFCPAALLLEKPVNIDQLPGFEEGRVSVQDAAAQLAAGLLDLQAGHTVLDVCAAPGGKTAHMLEMQPNLKHLLAIDNDETRLQRVKSGLSRLNLSAEICIGDALTPSKWWNGQPFDRILLDAPCSATGVIRRHPDIKLLRRETDLAVLQSIQQRILTEIWPLLASEGILLYATCSILKRENEQLIETFLNNHQDAKEIIIEAQWGHIRPKGRQILPGDHSMDGFYYAKIQKC